MEKKLLLFKEISDEYDRAYRLVSYLFKDKKDKAGEPYLGHLIRVSDCLSMGDAKVAALLHDVVEDVSDISFDDLKEYSHGAIDLNAEEVHLWDQKMFVQQRKGRQGKHRQKNN